MRIEVAWTPHELRGRAVQERAVAVVDVLRASTTVAVALANGARSVVPVASTEEALRIARSIGRGEVLLCGERRGLPIEGFDLGNSPEEFAPERVRGRVLVMTTTNGTRALLSAAGARHVFVAAFVNLDAVVRALSGSGEEALILCAGREGRVGADDALCAGRIAAALRRLQGEAAVELDDGALAAIEFARAVGPVSPEFLRSAGAGRALVAIGRAFDLDLCARENAVSVVPRYRDGQITAGQGLHEPQTQGSGWEVR